MELDVRIDRGAGIGSGRRNPAALVGIHEAEVHLVRVLGDGPAQGPLDRHHARGRAYANVGAGIARAVRSGIAPQAAVRAHLGRLTLGAEIARQGRVAGCVAGRGARGIRGDHAVFARAPRRAGAGDAGLVVVAARAIQGGNVTAEVALVEVAAGTIGRTSHARRQVAEAARRWYCAIAGERIRAGDRSAAIHLDGGHDIRFRQRVRPGRAVCGGNSRGKGHDARIRTRRGLSRRRGRSSGSRSSRGPNARACSAHRSGGCPRAA